MIKEENMSATINMLRFYKKCLEVYCQSSRKYSPVLHKSNENNPLYYIFQHIA